MQRLKNILLYDGLSSKEEYESIVSDIRVHYRTILNVSSVVLTFTFTILFFLSFYIETLKTNRIIYLLCAVVSFLVIFALRFFNKKNEIINISVTYVISSLMLGFGIISGTVNNPAEPAIAFCVLVSTVTFWTYDTIYRMIIYRFIMSCIFLIIAFQVKDPNVIWTDVVDICCYFSIGTFVGIFTQILTTSSFYLRRNMKKEIAEKTSQLENFSMQTVQAIVNTIDAKDCYTNGHSNRVALYSKMIAEKSGFSEEEINNLYYIAMLHDVG